MLGRREALLGNNVTEAEWLACTDPEPMLAFLEGKVTDRKLRLFAAACCRRVWHLVNDEPSRAAVDVAERVADGQATNAERRAAAKAGYARKGPATIAWQAVSCVATLRASHAANRTSTNAAWATATASSTTRLDPVGDNTAHFIELNERAAWEREAQAPLLRDVVGNPFRSVVLDAAWRAPAVLELAETIYRDRSFGRMPSLGEALRDAGCTNHEVLRHCLPGETHARGCWLVDLLLNRK